jgi:biotin synthase-like enzyme
MQFKMNVQACNVLNFEGVCVKNDCPLCGERMTLQTRTAGFFEAADDR